MRGRKFLTVVLCFALVLSLFCFRPITAEAALTDAELQAYTAVFDADYYYNTYSDVAAFIGYDQKALFNHFVEFGVNEGRSASAEFNPQAYRNRYTDLQAVYGDNIAAYCQHYVSFGKAEGRDGSSKGLFAEVQMSLAGDINDGQPVGVQLLGTCTTTYNARIARATNVELAAQRINGVVLQPGDSFSFSQTILPRTAANGYVVAPVFVNKKVSKGMGGGICQVSSTLYAAMINAGLPATERHAHSLPISYLPAGYDATIAGNSLDLKFDNIYDQPLMIAASAEKGTLTVSLYLVTAQ